MRDTSAVFSLEKFRRLPTAVSAPAGAKKSCCKCQSKVMEVTTDEIQASKTYDPFLEKQFQKSWIWVELKEGKMISKYKDKKKKHIS